MSTAHGTEKDERRGGGPSGGLQDRLRRASQTPRGFQLVEQPRGLGLGVVSGSATTHSSATRWQPVEDSQDRNVDDPSIMAWFIAPCFASLDHDVDRPVAGSGACRHLGEFRKDPDRGVDSVRRAVVEPCRTASHAGAS